MRSNRMSILHTHYCECGEKYGCACGDINSKSGQCPACKGKTVSNDTQVKQEDVSEAVRIVRYCQRSDLPFVQQQGFVEDALARVRREEREAAFKVLCAECAEGSAPTFDQDARWYYHGLGHTEVGCSASKLRIAALAASASDKGEMNGSDQTTKETRTDSGDL